MPLKWVVKNENLEEKKCISFSYSKTLCLPAQKIIGSWVRETHRHKSENKMYPYMHSGLFSSTYHLWSVQYKVASQCNRYIMGNNDFLSINICGKNTQKRTQNTLDNINVWHVGKDLRRKVLSAKTLAPMPNDLVLVSNALTCVLCT